MIACKSNFKMFCTKAIAFLLMFTAVEVWATPLFYFYSQTEPNGEVQLIGCADLFMQSMVDVMPGVERHFFDGVQDVDVLPGMAGCEFQGWYVDPKTPASNPFSFYKDRPMYGGDDLPPSFWDSGDFWDFYTNDTARTDFYAKWGPQVVAPSAPTGVSATDGSYTDYVRVTWSAVSGATSYNLYRSTSTSRPSTATKTGVTSPCDDTTATPGTKYYYWVSAVNSAGSGYSSYDTGYRKVSLTLGKSSDSYASAGGSGSASVTANTSWSASANVNWITFRTKSGSGNGTLTYTIAANTSTSSRTGTITVTAGAGTLHPVTKTISVSQEASAPTTYTVIFNANGGSGTMTSQTITYGVSTSLKANSFTQSGYTFAGWSKTAGGSVVYADGASVSNLAPAGGSITLYAVWTPQVVPPSAPTGVSATDGSYTDYVRVTWSAVSGATSYNLYRSTTTSRPSTATKTGVTSPCDDTTATPGAKYYYWVSAVNSAGSGYSSYDTGYRKVSLTLGKSSDSYASAGGSGSASVTANTSWSASANVNWITLKTKSGSGNGTLTYTIAANTSISSRTGTITVTAGAGTLHPVTKTISVSQEASAPTTYTVVFNANGGSGTMTSQTITYGVSTSLKANSFTQSGYTFAGWSKTADGSVVYADGASVSNLAPAGGSITLYAVWTEKGTEPEPSLPDWTPVVQPDTVIGYYVVKNAKTHDFVEADGSVLGVFAANGECRGATRVTRGPGGMMFQLTIGIANSSESGFFFKVWDAATGEIHKVNEKISSFAGIETFGSVVAPMTLTFIQGEMESALVRDGILIRYDGPIERGVPPSIPPEVRAIGDGCFALASNLTCVVIPGSVTNIGPYAFFGCSNLETVVFHEGLVSIDSGAFAQCVSLGEIALPSSVRRVGDALAPTNVVAAVVRRNDGASQDSTNFVETVSGRQISRYQEKSEELHEMMLWNRGWGVFDGCSTLASVTLNDGLEMLGAATFRDCDSLTELEVPRSVVRIGGQVEWVYRNVAQSISHTLDSYQDEDGATSVMSSDRTSQKDVTSFSHRDAGFLEGCVNLEYISLPQGLESIGPRAFADCGLLREVDLPDSLRALDRGTFCCCTGLERVGLPANLEVVGRGEMPFEWVRTYSCDMLSRNGGPASVLAEEWVKSVAEGVATTMVSENGGGWSVLTAEDHDMRYRPEDGVFYGCTSLRKLVMPATVRTLCDYSFADCDGLSSMTIHKGLESIGEGAFYGCNMLLVVYVDAGDVKHVKSLYDWPSGVEFVEVSLPSVVGDLGAIVTGDAETGYVIKPSEGKTVVEVSIPAGIDAGLVIVEVSPKVESVTPHGAKVKIVSGSAEITEFLDIPGTTRGDDGGVVATQPGGVIDLTKATVKDEIVKEAMDPAKGAKIELNAMNPKLTTPNTRKGLFYQLHEGTTLGGMADGDSTIGDGQPWSPKITVKGGNSAFYSIGVGKGE